MNKFTLVPVLLLLKFAIVSLTSLPLFFFDPLLALVALYTFFHSLDTKDFVIYALFCGFLGDIFSLLPFGTYMLAYLCSAFCVAFASRIVYRQNWVLCFPLVFAAVFLNHHFVFLLNSVLFEGAHISYGVRFFAIALLEALATSLVAYPLYLFSKKCLSELIV